nr:hypothetical protein [Saccharopolyspora soli]
MRLLILQDSFGFAGGDGEQEFLLATGEVVEDLALAGRGAGAEVV